MHLLAPSDPEEAGTASQGGEKRPRVIMCPEWPSVSRCPPLGSAEHLTLSGHSPRVRRPGRPAWPRQAAGAWGWWTPCTTTGTGAGCRSRQDSQPELQHPMRLQILAFKSANHNVECWIAEDLWCVLTSELASSHSPTKSWLLLDLYKDLWVTHIKLFYFELLLNMGFYEFWCPNFHC